MMNRLQFLLIKLAEESAEIAQISLKASQFGLDEIWSKSILSNKERMHREINDLHGIIMMLNSEFSFNYNAKNGKNLAAQLKKIEKINHYYEYSVSLGMVEIK